MKRTILTMLFLMIFSTQGFAQTIKNPAITFVKEVQYPVGAGTVRALDINGAALLRLDGQGAYKIPTVLLGGDNAGSDQHPGLTLEVLYQGAIVDSTKTQLVVRLPDNVISGTHTLFINYGLSPTVPNRGPITTSIFEFTIGAVGAVGPAGAIGAPGPVGPEGPSSAKLRGPKGPRGKKGQRGTVGLRP